MNRLQLSVLMALLWSAFISCTGTLWSRDTIVPDSEVNVQYYGAAVVSVGADNRPAILVQRSITAKQAVNAGYHNDIYRQELVLLRTDVRGQLAESFVLDQTNKSSYSPVQLRATPDGGFIALYYLSDQYNWQLMRINSSGTVVWIRPITVPGTPRLYSLLTDAMGTIFVSGYYFPSAGNPAAFISKLTPQGEVVWTQSYLNASAGSYGYTLTLTPTGGCVLSGQIGATNNVIPKQSFLLETNADGSLLWSKIYQTPAITAHLPLADGYLLTGQLARNNDFPVYLAKTSLDGTRQWYQDNLLASFYNLPVYLFADQTKYTVLGNGSTLVPTPGNGFLLAQFDQAGNPLSRTISISINGPVINDSGRFGTIANWPGNGYLTGNTGSGGVLLTLVDFNGQLSWSNTVIRGIQR